jgi:L-lactate dehydrogenase complex protein LldE
MAGSRRRFRADRAVRIGLFVTCVNDTLFPQAGQAAVQILERLGHRVEFPLEQTCCGQMHVNSGYEREGLPLVRRFLDVFDGFDAVVAPSGSCVAMVREQYPRLAGATGESGLIAAAQRIVPRVHELSEFLVNELAVEDLGAFFPHRVTYHASCHGLRTLGLGEAPLRLLRNVRGIDLVPLPEADQCCGFGGTFAVKNADVSAAMMGDKIRAIIGTGAEVCVAMDSSCLLHIGGGLSRQRAGVAVKHVAEVLAATETA